MILEIPCRSTICVGDNHRGHLKNRGKTHFLWQTKNTNDHRCHKTRRDNHGLAAEAHGLGGLSGPPEQSASAPLGRNSVSLEGHCTVLTRLPLLEGWTPPRAKLRITRGSHGLAAPATTPLTGAFNVPTHAGTQLKS
jgi:hypothetical protein